MRTHGTLTKWNDDRGFGFISPAQGNAELFVHISEFPRDGVRPRINEPISFETETGPNGKLRAIRVERPGQRLAPRRPRATGRSKRSAKPVAVIVVLLAVAVICTYGYSRFTKAVPESRVVQTAVASPSQYTTFTCDGRTMCPQMTSCAEARYFIQHCPNTTMDGDGDGVPCERQWCN
ncbi:MAG: cold-shock protein [Gammaproteobacteria bacterium HGW-Gammaproteobacteria-4]|jgi:cold shock CspA family protein|nr:MAG: cold-shock protein [Gammaproteobacteria bacterium HGW-Gammaproteobacteria-4]